MTPTPDYFRNIEPKVCTDCGKIIEEMHESYLNQCDKCLRFVEHI